MIALLLTLVLCTSLVACGKSNDTTKDSTSDSTDGTTEVTQGSETTEKVENIVFAFPCTQVVDGIKQVQDEINKITEAKINVHVTLNPITWADYENQIGLMMTGGEQIDIVTVGGNFSQLVARNQLMSMDAYADTYAAGAKEVVGEQFLETTTVNKSLYAIPTLNGKAAVVNICLRKDLLEENGISLANLKEASTFDEYLANLDELSKIFAQLKATNPDLVCLAPSYAGSLIFSQVIPGYDSLGDGYGVLPKDGTKIINMAESAEYKTLLGYAHDWYNKGYILQDSATTTESSYSYLSSGRVAGFFISAEIGAVEQITNATGVDVESVKLLKATIETGAVNYFGFGISSTSDYPEAAMKFINEMYTNADIVNLLDWGVEGVHYVKHSDGTVGFPEGVDVNNTTYGLNEDWLFGNQFLSYIWGEGRDTTIYSKLEANNKNAYYSPALGFTYDSTPIMNELTAVINVNNEYGPGLNTGTLDPETELPKYIDALKSAGIDTIIAEKQKQLDSWMAENKK